VLKTPFPLRAREGKPVSPMFRFIPPPLVACALRDSILSLRDWAPSSVTLSAVPGSETAESGPREGAFKCVTLTETNEHAVLAKFATRAMRIVLAFFFASQKLRKVRNRSLA
jgi:hypothetical protein